MREATASNRFDFRDRTFSISSQHHEWMRMNSKTPEDGNEIMLKTLVLCVLGERMKKEQFVNYVI